MIKRVTNDAREDEMEENLGQVSFAIFVIIIQLTLILSKICLKPVKFSRYCSV
jgi:hypothetical protein